MQKNKTEIIDWDAFLRKIKEAKDGEGRVALSNLVVWLGRAADDEVPDATLDLGELGVSSLDLSTVQIRTPKADAENGGEDRVEAEDGAEEDEDDDEDKNVDDAYIRIVASDGEPSVVMNEVRCCWVGFVGPFSVISFKDVHFERLVFCEDVQIEKLSLNGHFGVLKMGAGEEGEIQYEYGSGTVEEFRFNGALLKEAHLFLPPWKVYVAEDGIMGENGEELKFFTCGLDWVRVIRAYEPDANFILSIDLSES